MFVRFAVENFLSFKEMTEFSMAAAKITRHKEHIAVCKGRRLLKGAYIFGANAGGKTNLIKAIAFAQNVVVNGLDNIDCEKKYFRVDKACREKPGIFQFDIYTQGHFYSYGFALAYNTAAIEEEWLYQIDDPDKEICIFLRSKNELDDKYTVDSDLTFQEKVQQDRFAIYADDIATAKMKRTFFLKDVVERSPEEVQEYQPFRDVLNWLLKLVIIFPESKYMGIPQLLDNDTEKTNLEKLLNYFDTGINNLSKKEVKFDKAFANLPNTILENIKVNFSKNLKKPEQSVLASHEDALFEIKKQDGKLVAYEVVANHGNEDDMFEYQDESDGTQRLFDLLPLFQKLTENSVVLIDELDRSIHTILLLKFINHFYQITAYKPAQLIVTTHDANVMDLDIVRQDEIWFVERQRDHSSQLYSLNQFRIRFDKKVEKDYLLGRYGAIPVFRQMALETGDEEEGLVNEQVH